MPGPHRAGEGAVSRRGVLRGWLQVGLVIALAAGCAEERDDPAARLQQEVGEALDAAGEYAARQKEGIEKRARRALDELDRELEETNREVEESSEGLSRQAEERLEAAKDRAQGARRKAQRGLDDLASATSDRWNEAVERVLQALEELEEARKDIVAALAGRDDEGG